MVFAGFFGSSFKLWVIVWGCSSVSMSSWLGSLQLAFVHDPLFKLWFIMLIFRENSEEKTVDASFGPWTCPLRLLRCWFFDVLFRMCQIRLVAMIAITLCNCRRRRNFRLAGASRGSLCDTDMTKAKRVHHMCHVQNLVWAMLASPDFARFIFSFFSLRFPHRFYLIVRQFNGIVVMSSVGLMTSFFASWKAVISHLWSMKSFTCFMQCHQAQSQDLLASSSGSSTKHRIDTEWI